MCHCNAHDVSDHLQIFLSVNNSSINKSNAKSNIRVQSVIQSSSDNVLEEIVKEEQTRLRNVTDADNAYRTLEQFGKIYRSNFTNISIKTPKEIRKPRITPK